MTGEPDKDSKKREKSKTACTREPVAALYGTHLRKGSPDDLDACVLQSAQHELERDDTPRPARRRWRMGATLAAGFLLGAFAVYLWFTVDSSDDIEIAEDPQPSSSLQQPNPSPDPGADSTTGVPKAQ
jgi:hypothetical protein